MKLGLDREAAPLEPPSGFGIPIDGGAETRPSPKRVIPRKPDKTSSDYPHPKRKLRLQKIERSAWIVRLSLGMQPALAFVAMDENPDTHQQPSLIPWYLRNILDTSSSPR